MDFGNLPVRILQHVCFLCVSDIWGECEQWGCCSPWAAACHPGSLHPLHPSGLEQKGTHWSTSGALRLLILWVPEDKLTPATYSILFYCMHHSRQVWMRFNFTSKMFSTSKRTEQTMRCCSMNTSLLKKIYTQKIQQNICWKLQPLASQV